MGQVAIGLLILGGVCLYWGYSWRREPQNPRPREQQGGWEAAKAERARATRSLGPPFIAVGWAAGAAGVVAAVIAVLAR